MSGRFFRLVIVLPLLFVAAGPIPAQVFSGKIAASDAGPQDEFGVAVAVSGDICAVGAQFGDFVGFNSGVVYVYRYSGGVWQEEQIVSPQDAFAQDWFGWSVALDGDLLVVGAYGADDLGENSGAAYVFRYDGTQWNEETKLLPGDGGENDRFGVSVAAQGDVAVVGANLQAGTGAAYVFRQGTGGWEQEMKLTASDGSPDDHFGVRVALSGETLVVGSPQLVVPGGSGAAYVFEENGGAWPEVAKLTAADGEGGDWFGLGLAVRPDAIVIGAPGDGDSGDFSGSAYVFGHDSGSWEQEAKITATDGSFLDQFGSAIGLQEEAILVGSPRGFEGGARTGAVYRFVEVAGDWVQIEKLVAPDGDFEDQYGIALAVGSEALVVGASRDDDAGVDSGSAYTYRLGPIVAPLFSRGDCTDDGIYDISDAIFLLDHLFDLGSDPSCADACDTNDDGQLEVADAIYSLNYLVAYGPAPPPPFGFCGEDPTDDSVGCVLSSLCP